MKHAHWPSMLGAALLLAGCAAREDVIRESSIGYIENSTQVVAAADWSRAETVTVTLSEFSFSPANLTFATGSPYRLLIRNIGNIQHLFVADGFFKGIAAQRLKTPDGEVEAPHLAAIAVPPRRGEGARLRRSYAWHLPPRMLVALPRHLWHGG